MNSFFDANDILTRAKQVLRLKTDTELARFLGIARSTLANWYARNSIDFPLVLSKLEWINYNWLLTGKGNPEKNSAFCNSEGAKGEVNILYKGKIKENLQERSVPLYDISAAANLSTLLTDKSQYMLGKITIPNIPQCDGALYISGDSMYPILKAGDIIGFKQVLSVSSIIFGEMYIVSFNCDGDEYLVVKYINHSEKEGHIKLVSYNVHHDPIDIPIDAINSLGLVKFSIRKHVMK